jgi:hypothetical protein
LKYPKFVRGTLPALLLAASIAPAPAELKPCGSGVEGFKVYADGMLQTDSVSLVEAQHPDLGRLQVILDSVARSVEDLKDDLQGVPFHMIRCSERQPTGEGEFNPAMLQRMLESKVILEVWGRLDARQDANGVFQPVAELSYLVVPLRTHAQADDHLGGYYSADYVGVIAQDPDVELVDHAEEVKPFTALGLGLRHLENQDFVQAFTAFCTAHRLLLDIPDTSPVGENLDLDKLRAWTSDTVWVVHRLATAPDTPQNAIKLLGPEVIAETCKVEMP